MMTGPDGSVGGKACMAMVLAGLILTPSAAHGQIGDTLDLDAVPKQVMDALMARFPQAEIRQVTREEEEDIVIYDFEFTQQGQKLEADIKEDGTFHNWEREIAAADLPEAVKAAVESEYPESVLKEIMAITAVVQGNDVLEGYEITLETADDKEGEVTVAPDGTIVEEDFGPGG